MDEKHVPPPREVFTAILRVIALAFAVFGSRDAGSGTRGTARNYLTFLTTGEL